MNKDKEMALKDFLDMIIKSWTWERLTEDERKRCTQALTRAHLSGTWYKRWEQLHDVYVAFLLALDYNAVGWRETDPDVPRF